MTAATQPATDSAVRRTSFLLVGIVCYLLFLAVFLYAIGFVGNVGVPWSIDSEPRADRLRSLLVDALLLAAFAVPHSVMARPGFKRWWTRWVPQALERSVYVLCSSLLLAVLFWQWHPVIDVIWDIETPVLRWSVWTLFWAGWVIALWSTFLLDYFDLVGLRQVYLYFQGQPYAPLGFRTPALYRYIRHPIMLGFLLAFWATPRMTTGHLLFAVLTTAYVLVALRLEERDLVRSHGLDYEAYRARTGMLLPRLFLKGSRSKDV
jgi:protein-S-isoprenylcysteine O-methyltransferase Ste14